LAITTTRTEARASPCILQGGIASDAADRAKMNGAARTGMYAPEMEKEAVPA
jgi:hypothetical protein